MGTQYRLYNGHMPTTGGPPAGVVTSATLFTQLQIVTAAGFPGKVIEWGVSMNGAALVAGFPCALITTGAIAATVTAFAAADAMPYCDPNAPANTTAGSTSYPFNMSTATVRVHFVGGREHLCDPAYGPCARRADRRVLQAVPAWFATGDRTSRGAAGHGPRRRHHEGHGLRRHRSVSRGTDVW